MRDASVNSVLRFGPARTFELGPGVAAVGRFPQRAAGTSAVVSPPGAAPLKRRRVEDFRIRRIDGDVVEAGIGIDVLRLLPGLAAVDRFVQAAIGIGAEQMARPPRRRRSSDRWDRPPRGRSTGYFRGPDGSRFFRRRWCPRRRRRSKSSGGCSARPCRRKRRSDRTARWRWSRSDSFGMLSNCECQ